MLTQSVLGYKGDVLATWTGKTRSFVGDGTMRLSAMQLRAWNAVSVSFT